ncbi:M61 family metallopeptidase [Robertkochia aurantiaca]|uniref:M61 family metallopeptidase n=1 Tax=Robertkochia aurantiaca TaxID=2873700 RepID=UPI001CCFD80B|nr:peptidase M61 [Robertkochia sp. 3YJGBD-33]
MKKILLISACALLLSCGPKLDDLAVNRVVEADIDLVNVENDMVKVRIDPGRFTEETINYYIPRTVPGTYSNDDYGKYVENLKAFDYSGSEVTVNKTDTNTWELTNATEVDYLEYLVNDTFDTEGEVEEPVFSPAGSNIEAGENYFLNLHMFVGYFSGLDQRPYEITFVHPESLEVTTSLTEMTPEKASAGVDTFYAERYFEVTDNPVMYAKPDTETFLVNDIQVTLSVFSPNQAYSAASISDEMEKMMAAQKKFLGDLNTTDTYQILLFFSDMEETSPTGFGALEHHTSTTVVLPESMPEPMLLETMTDVVSHEFFHIVTPLSIHAEEIHFFDYNNPKMSKHLWMYEGVTEYFANLFQVNQGLIDNQAFYDRILRKIENSRRYNDEMSFTEMSENILMPPYKENYANVYEKGALIGMCIDLIIREQSQGEKGILWLMKELSAFYGKDQPFADDELIPKITSLTYPEVADFLTTHVEGTEPIDYNTYFTKAGLQMGTDTITTAVLFRDQQTPFIDANPQSKEIFFRDIPLNSLLTELGIQGGDVIQSINGTEYNLDSAQQLVVASMGWQEGDPIEMVVLRDGETVEVSGTISQPTVTVDILREDPDATQEQKALREAWLKG